MIESGLACPACSEDTGVHVHPGDEGDRFQCRHCNAYLEIEHVPEEWEGSWRSRAYNRLIVRPTVEVTKKVRLTGSQKRLLAMLAVNGGQGSFHSGRRMLRIRREGREQVAEGDADTPERMVSHGLIECVASNDAGARYALTEKGSETYRLGYWFLRYQRPEDD